MRFTLNVNGRTHAVEVPAQRTLLDTLRDDLGLISVREACGIGICGACTILVDGQAMSACLMLASLSDGREIRTVEGLGHGERLDPVQEAFVERSGFQCSYCTPGMVLATKALLAEQPSPSREQVAEYLAGNLCRCASYKNILDAVELASTRVRDR